MSANLLNYNLRQFLGGSSPIQSSSVHQQPSDISGGEVVRKSLTDIIKNAKKASIIEHPTICLNMIVKNESRIITRLLDSCISIIDAYCIVDTGSSDNTVDIIKEYFNNHNKNNEKQINGVILYEPFKNFGYNRTHALEQANKLDNIDYVLLLDADMVLSVGKDFNRSLLTKNAYQILQVTSNMKYANVRFIKTNIGARCVGVTHEYYDIPNGNTGSFSEELMHIKDLGDGGAKVDKFERDIRLLTAGIEDPETSKDLRGRYLFYLANSYFDIGKNEEAIDNYKKRIEVGGWLEEVWYSYYRIGLAYVRLKQPENAFWWWLMGYQHYPRRAENILEMVRYARERGQNNLAYAFYRLGKSIPYPKDDVLFINHTVYEYQFDYEMSIFGYYCGVPHQEIAKAASRVLNAAPGLWGSVISNYKWYAPVLSKSNMLKWVKDYSFQYTLNFIGSEHKIVSGTPTLYYDDVSQTMYMNIRCVNYHILPNGQYQSFNRIITVNRLCKLSPSWDIVSYKDILPEERVTSHYLVGIEDIRIGDGGQYVVGTVPKPDTSHEVIVGIGRINLEGGEIYDITPIKSPYNRSCEKNWTLLPNDRIIYEWYPFTVGTRQNDTIINMIKMDDTPLFFNNMRGSSCVFKFNNYYYVSIHCAEYKQPRQYYTSIVRIDMEPFNAFMGGDKSALNKSHFRYTVLFKFEGESIEFSTGLHVDDENMYLGYSTWDRTTKIACLSMENVEKMFI